MTDPSSERVSGGDLLLVPALEKLATRDNVAGVVGAYTSAVTSAVARTGRAGVAAGIQIHP